MTLVQPTTEVLDDLDEDEGETHTVCCLDDHTAMCGAICEGEPVVVFASEPDCIDCYFIDHTDPDFCPLFGKCVDDD